MSKSNIALAVLAGLVIGGIVVIVLKAEGTLKASAGADENDEKENTRTKEIAKQFSERISPDLEAAEMKIRSGAKKDSGFIKSQGEFGVFL